MRQSLIFNWSYHYAMVQPLRHQSNPYNPRQVAVQVTDTGGLSGAMEGLAWKAEDAMPDIVDSFEDLPPECQSDIESGDWSHYRMTDNGNILHTEGIRCSGPVEDRPDDANFYIEI